MRIKQETKLDFDDVLIIPKRSTLKSRIDVDIERHFKFKYSPRPYIGIPIIASNMTSVGTLETAKVLAKLGCLTCLHKYIDPISEQDAFEIFNNTFLTIGEDADFTSYNKNYSLCLDAANGYREEFVTSIKKLREVCPDTLIMAGNVCTPEMTEQLLLAGADIVKVGIGSGGQCTTRLKAGIGYPQLSAIIESADAAHGLKGHIVSDGGCREPGDVCKAFAAGADFVMLGSMLAAHDENTDPKDIKEDLSNVPPGTFECDEKMFIKYYTHIYGMSSRTAQEKYHNGIAQHRTSEGKTTKVYLRGPIRNTINDILASLRSCCTYVGAASLKELSRRATFIMVNRQRNTFYDNEQVGD